MLTVILSVFGAVSRIGGIIGPALSSMGAVTAAAIGAVPATLTAFGAFLKAVGESPVLSLLFGASLGGALAFMYGLSFDAPIREKHKREAVKQANARADVAVAKMSADHARRVADLCRRIPTASKPQTCR